MRIWYARDTKDAGGEASVWDGRSIKPRLGDAGSLRGEWNLPSLGPGRCLCEDTQEAWRTFGPGHHGVKPGECKRLNLVVVDTSELDK